MIVKCFFEEGEPLVVEGPSLRELVRLARRMRLEQDSAVISALYDVESFEERLAGFNKISRRCNILKYVVWR
jgi:hypothetical protein